MASKESAEDTTLILAATKKDTHHHNNKSQQHRNNNNNDRTTESNEDSRKRKRYGCKTDDDRSSEVSNGDVIDDDVDDYDDAAAGQSLASAADGLTNKRQRCSGDTVRSPLQDECRVQAAPESQLPEAALVPTKESQGMTLQDDNEKDDEKPTKHMVDLQAESSLSTEDRHQSQQNDTLADARTADQTELGFHTTSLPVPTAINNTTLSAAVETTTETQAEHENCFTTPPHPPPPSHATTQQYIAPEQALVTSVEMVVPPPSHAAVYGSTTNGRYTATSNNLTIDETHKTDGCAIDSSSESKALTNPTNLTLATATGDILSSTTNPSGIWTPHSDYKQPEPHGTRLEAHEQHERLAQKLEKHYGPQTDDNDNYRMQQQQQQQHELMLENVKREGVYTQMMQMQQHYSHHQQNMQQHQHHTVDMYTQMLHQQQHQQHQQQSINAQQQQQQHHSHYASYPHLQQHYPHDQLFNMHPQDHLHSHAHPHQLQAPMHIQQQQPQPPSMNLQQQQQQQQQSHHHHPQQIADVYHDLMIDEFPEDPNSTYKLTLSPNTVKPENQDDGYETSAGDVLTPNSHSSSTHSVTPQHQLQHAVVNLMSQQTNPEEHHQTQQSAKPTPATPHSHPPIHIDERQLNENLNSSLTSEVGTNLVNANYNFVDDELRLMSPSTGSSAAPAGVGGNVVNVAGYMRLNENGQPLAMATTTLAGQNQHQLNQQATSVEHVNAIMAQHVELNAKPPPKRRGRKKKILEADAGGILLSSMNPPHVGAGELTDTHNVATPPSLLKSKERKKHDRFNGMSEDEVIKRTIPDHLADNLDIVIVGINPGLFAAYKGHHYAGPGNHFWKCLYLAGLTQEQMSADEDFKLLKIGIGFTNMVARATKGSADLTRKEIKEGCRVLLEKLQRFRPKIAVFNGKLIFEVFSGKKDFNFGRQPDCVEGTETYIWVMPSSSARCAQLPRAADKVPFYAALKKFRDYLNGLVPHIDESECVFTEQRIKQCCEQQQPPPQQPSTDHSFLYSENADMQTREDLTNGGGVGGAPNQNDKMLTHITGSSENVGGGYLYSSGSAVGDNNMSLMGHTHGAGPPMVDGGGYVATTAPFGQEKKKRGRPKKIRGQEIIDPTTGNKVIINNHAQLHNATQNDFNNILNLSMMSAVSGGDEAPKKKRGRPKKQKPTAPSDITLQSTTTPAAKQQHAPQQQQQQQHTQTNVLGMNVLALDHTIAASPQQHQSQQSLYNTPPPSHIHIYTSSASPMASPALNCTYNRSTPPISAHADTPPIMEQHMISSECNNNSPTERLTQTQTSVAVHVPDPIREAHLGETPPPSSPNICSVDFEPPTAQQEQQQLEKSRYASSPAHDQHSHEHYQQWLSSTSSLSPHHHHQQQQQQKQHLQQQQHESPVSSFGQQTYQETSTPPWQSRVGHQPRYEDLGANQYLVSPPQQQQQQQQQHHQHSASPQQQMTPHLASDVARKSLSGLESLVDQIPTINESEASAMSSATVAAAAAAVESRLLGLQQQQQQHQQQQQCTDNHNESDVQNEQFSSGGGTSTSNASLLNSSFSVSNLAASSATSHLSSNLHNPSAVEYGQSAAAAAAAVAASPGAYHHHHPNLISAALAAAAVNTPTAHHVSHTQMYMDPHMSAMAHVPVNPMYGPPPPTAGPPPHPHAHAGHAYQAYGQASTHTQHNATSNAEYSHYGQSAAGALHLPSPNYPYGHHYGHTAAAAAAAAAQSNYGSYTHPHHHPTHHGHSTHHLSSVFERLKPSDIGGYGGF